MSGSSDHRATIVDKGIRMKIKRKSPPPPDDATKTGSRPVDDVTVTSAYRSKRKRLKATKTNVDDLRNGNIEAHSTGSRLPKRKQQSLNCMLGDVTGSRDSQVGLCATSESGHCRDALSSTAVDGVVDNSAEHPTSHQVTDTCICHVN